MYQGHWGLRESPFVGGLNRQRFYRSPTHDEALARLHFLADERRCLGLLLGASGSGKSLVFEVLAHEAAREGQQIARANLLGIGELEFLRQLADSLGTFPGRGEPMHGLWRAITDRLYEHRCQQLHTLVLLDDADEAPPEVLEQVVRLAQHDARYPPSLTVVLAAASHRTTRLGRRILALRDLRIELEPWTSEDTAQFISDALERCGRMEPIFDSHALLRLHELTHGVPRHLCQLADLCLLAGAAQGLHSIDESTVETVSHEFGLRDAVIERVG